MKTKTPQLFPTTHPIEWFIERIGKEIMAKSATGFNGIMQIESENHAGYLCNIAQKHLFYQFSELKTD